MFDRLLFWLREKARLLFGENTTVSASVSATDKLTFGESISFVIVPAAR